MGLVPQIRTAHNSGSAPVRHYGKPDLLPGLPVHQHPSVQFSSMHSGQTPANQILFFPFPEPGEILICKNLLVIGCTTAVSPAPTIFPVPGFSVTGWIRWDATPYAGWSTLDRMYAALCGDGNGI